MATRIRSRLSYANVVASMALFIALGGSAYAALTVTGKNVENGSLSGRDVRDESLTGAQIKRLTADDFRGGRVISGDSSVVEANGTVQSDGVGLVAAQCPPRTTVTGGGFDVADTGGIARSSQPAGQGWIVYVEEATPGAQFTAYAACAP